jgi:probable DNA metabolism protein
VFVIFDSTFDGLLSAVAYCFRGGIQPSGLVSDLDALPILEYVDIARESNIRRLFLRHLQRQLGSSAGEAVLDTVYQAFLSELPGIADQIFHYLARSLELRQDPAARLFEPAVAAVVQAAKRVGGQTHKYLGLLRFREICPGILQADFEPDYHLLPLLLPHFCDRFSDQNFVIRDLRRQLAAFHAANGPVHLYVLADTAATAGAGVRALTNRGEQLRMPAPSGDGRQPDADAHGQALAAAGHPGDVRGDAGDEWFAGVWREYLQHLTIPERKNLALQQHFIPRKYWKYLVEQPGIH